MRMIVMTAGMSLALVLASWLSGFTQQPTLQPPLQPAAIAPTQVGNPSSDTQVLSTVFANGNVVVQQVVVVDSRHQSMAVYHVSAATGKIELKSVRKISFDMALEQFNAVEPLPSDMRMLRP